MSVGSPFHARTASLNRTSTWREWSGFLAAGRYAAHHDIEYNAIRNAAALIDVSPLYKYRVSGPGARRLVDRVVTRDVSQLEPGGVIYTPWCDSEGKVIDDGTVHALDDGAFRWTAADPQWRWLMLNSRGLDVRVDDESEPVAAVALQGPLSRQVLEAATGTSFADLRYFRRRSARVGSIEIDVSRTGYTGDLGYELWVSAEQAIGLWDALMVAGGAYGLRACGILALDVCRVEAGLILLEVDYTSARHALIPGQSYSPFEIGLGRMVALDKETPYVGRAALRAEAAGGGPPRRLVGLELDHEDLERAYARADLPPALPATTWRELVPVHGPRGQVGRATSGTWSPILKAAICLASVEAASSVVGTRLSIEWTVEGRRGRVACRVVPLPFYDPPQKRA